MRSFPDFFEVTKPRLTLKTFREHLIFVIYSAEISSLELLFGSHKNKNSNLDIPFHIQAMPNHQTSFRDLRNPAEHFKLSCMKPLLRPACPPPPPLLPFLNRSSSKMAMENGQGKGTEGGGGGGEERPSNESLLIRNITTPPGPKPDQFVADTVKICLHYSIFLLSYTYIFNVANPDSFIRIYSRPRFLNDGTQKLPWKL
jgi:hypothetical protein